MIRFLLQGLIAISSLSWQRQTSWSLGIFAQENFSTRKKWSWTLQDTTLWKCPVLRTHTKVNTMKLCCWGQSNRSKVWMIQVSSSSKTHPGQWSFRELSSNALIKSFTTLSLLRLKMKWMWKSSKSSDFQGTKLIRDFSSQRITISWLKSWRTSVPSCMSGSQSQKKQTHHKASLSWSTTWSNIQTNLSQKLLTMG